MTRLTDSNPLVARSIEEERIRRVEENLRVIEIRLANNYTLGRLRFDRTAPVNSGDVQSPDRPPKAQVNSPAKTAALRVTNA